MGLHWFMIQLEGGAMNSNYEILTDFAISRYTSFPARPPVPGFEKDLHRGSLVHEESPLVRDWWDSDL